MNKEEEKQLLIQNYRRTSSKKLSVIFVLLGLNLIFFFLSLFVGSSGLSFADTFKAFFGIGEETSVLIVYRIRMPRVLAALIAGGGLAISGCVMQSVLRNPMASPSTLGVSNAAVFGANIAIILLGAGSYYSANNPVLSLNNPYLVSTFALIFSLIAVGIVLLLSRLRRFSNESIVLAGIAIGAIFSAGTTLIQFFSSDTQISSAVYWTFGNLSRANYKEDLILGIVTVVSLVFFWFRRWDYSALAHGSDTAASLGVNVMMMTIVSLLLASLITSVSVSFLGIIGFVGLLAPQVMKRIIGDDFRYLLPSSFLMGSFVLLFSDTLGRILIPGVTLPVGAITSILGGPVFIYILLAGKEKKA